MSDNAEDSSLYKEFLDGATLTDEDRKRKFTDEELKWICLNKECKVDMTLFNSVENCVKDFKQSGRSKNWSEKLLLKMVVKTLNHHERKHGEIYPEKTIAEYNELMWEPETKHNIRMLKERFNISMEHTEENTSMDTSNVSDDKSIETTTNVELPPGPSSSDSEDAFEQTVVLSSEVVSTVQNLSRGAQNLYTQYMHYNTDSLEINSESLRQTQSKGQVNSQNLLQTQSQGQVNSENLLPTESEASYGNFDPSSKSTQDH